METRDLTVDQLKSGDTLIFTGREYKTYRTIVKSLEAFIKSTKQHKFLNGDEVELIVTNDKDESFKFNEKISKGKIFKILRKD